jgi:RNA polymerase sigma-70 factor (ECF subfamily)
MALEKPGEPGESGDRELLQALALSVNSAFAFLMEKYERRLSTFIVSQVGDQEIAADILQESWIRVYQALSQYKAERIRSLSLRAWLFAIVKNQIRDYFGKKNRLSMPFTEELENTLEDTFELSAEERVEIKEQMEVVLEAMKQLPDIPRIVLQLRFLQELDFQEIADRLGLTVSNVRTHSSRGLRALRRKLTTSIN